MHYSIEREQQDRFPFQTLIVSHKTTNRGLHMLSYLGPRLWNGLHTEIKSTSNENNIKQDQK